MAEKDIDFSTLKYNLYEILNIQPDTDQNKIKKSFMKIIKNFHPDKNSELEEDIYYHIIIANQVLSNSESRKKYDEYLNGRAETFIDLKAAFSKNIDTIAGFFADEETSKKQFSDKIEELNKKHGYTTDLDNESILEKFTKAQQKRESNNITIEQEKFTDPDDFNAKFEANKEPEGKFCGQIIEQPNNGFSELTSYTGSGYTNIGDLNKLYVEDSVLSTQFSSLDMAFSLQPKLKPEPEKTLEERMLEYRNQSDLFSNMKPEDFSNSKFNEW